MSDINHIFGNDISVSASGDILCCNGTAETQQRVIRRLSTNPGDYWWNTGYGAGLPAMIGSPVTASQIAAIAQQQMYLEADVAQNPPPQISVVSDTKGDVFLSIQYLDSFGTTSGLDVPIAEN